MNPTTSEHKIEETLDRILLLSKQLRQNTQKNSPKLLRAAYLRDNC